MRRAGGWLLAMALAGCEAEPQLAVSRASLLDVPPEASLTNPSATPLAVARTAAELLKDRLAKEITAANLEQKVGELDTWLNAEILALETRLTPVEVEMEE